MVSEHDPCSYVIVLILTKLERGLHATSMLNPNYISTDGTRGKINLGMWGGVLKEVPIEQI